MTARWPTIEQGHTVTEERRSEPLAAEVATQRRHPLANCEQCPLNSPEYGYVPSFGPQKADIAIVGQNPGQNEIRTGKPFVGASGRLLDAVLKHYQLDRSKMFITNACLCVHRKENVKPPAAAVNACRPRLIAELQAREVKQVVALGNVPAQGLLHTKETITRLRVGTYRDCMDLPGVQLFSTFHPAFCLRTAAAFPSMANDFGKLVHPPPPWVEPGYVVLETVGQAIQGIRELRRRGIKKVSLDIETAVRGDKDTSFDHPARYRILCIGLAYAADKAVVFGYEASQSPFFMHMLKRFLDECEDIIAQNGKFDKQGCYAKECDFTFTRDTMLQSYCLDERPGHHGLKIQLVEKLGYPRYDNEIKRYIGKGKAAGFANIPKPILYKYNAYDICGTFALDEYNTRLIEADNFAEPVRERADGEKWGLERLHKFMVETANNLAYTELNGMGVDLKYNSELIKEYDAEIRQLERKMFRVIGSEFNPRSPMQLKDVFHELGITLPIVRRPNGTFSETTDADTLQELYQNYKDKDKEHKGTLQGTLLEAPDSAVGAEVFEVEARSKEVQFLEALLAHRKAVKYNGTYARGLRKHVWKGRVFPTVMIHSTVTGRTSQKRPSLQVIPRRDKLKRQFCVVKPEHLLGEFDYGQIELRVLTWLAKEDYFRDIFADPSRDLFDELEPVIQPSRSGRVIENKKDRRNVVKCYVYGLAYGREAKSIADEFDLTVQEAERGLRAFFRVIPNIVAFREKTKWTALNGDDLVTPFGRRRRFPLITNENKKEIENESCAFYPQSIASDICIQAFDWLRPTLKGVAWCRNLVHDALFWEFHQNDLEYVSKTVIETMQKSAYAVMGDYVPIKVGADVGRNWGDLIPLADWQAGKRPYPTAVELWRPR
jgi:uracil-DNA glycosylase